MWKVLGIMSGSSLDGTDFCFFNIDFGTWKYTVEHTETLPYPEEIFTLLKNSNPENYFETDALYSHYLGKLIVKECNRIDFSPDVIGIHGHTFAHNPKKGFSVQLGRGEIINTYIRTPIVTEFRTKDIALGGEGAPLVPLGELFLFPEYNLFLNLGGIANFSFLKEKKFLASDISPFNQVLNALANQLEKKFDKNGELARQGKYIPEFAEYLSDWDFYKLPLPKSLSNQKVQKFIRRKVFDFEGDIKDKLHTVSVHFAEKIAEVFRNFPDEKVMITGGGAYHRFFMEQLKKRLDKKKIHLPSPEIIEYKEALIFGFLGLRKWLGLKNVLGIGSGKILSSGSISK